MTAEERRKMIQEAEESCEEEVDAILADRVEEVVKLFGPTLRLDMSKFVMKPVE